MDGRVWLNATSKIQRRQNKPKSCNGKFRSNKSAVCPVKSTVVWNSLMSFGNVTFDTSNYKQTNIHNYLTKKCRTETEVAGAKVHEKKTKKNQSRKVNGDMFSDDMSLPVTKTNIQFPDPHESFDAGNNLDDDILFSPPITREVTDPGDVDEFNDIPYSSSCSEFFESQPIVKSMTSETSKKANLPTGLDLIKAQKPNLENGKFSESTIMVRLHEESCDTLLDPESDTGVSRKVTGLNSCIKKLHEYSCHTNLDPDTEVPYQFDDDQSSRSMLKQNILKDIHIESLQTNLDPHTDHTCNLQALQDSQNDAMDVTSNPNSEPIIENSSRTLKQKFSTDIHNQSLYTNLDPHTELNSFPNKENKKDVLIELNNQSFYTNLDPFTEEEKSPLVCVQTTDRFKKRKENGCCDQNIEFSSSSDEIVEPLSKKPFQIYQDEKNKCHMQMDKFPRRNPSILRDKIIFNDSSSGSPDVVSDVKRAPGTNEIGNRKNFDKENIVGYDSFWDG